jgi:tRNA G18 (ribose-2'-O)-methylase SpoU
LEAFFLNSNQMRKLENSELERKSVADFKQAEKTPIIIILDDIRSLHNIGSVFRTSDAFLIEKIYLCGITAIPPNKEIHKTALGATETVAWEYNKDVLEVIENLKKQNTLVYAIEQVENSIFLNNFNPVKNTKYALVFGNEVYGVSQEAIQLCDGSIEIPQLGTKHSLNISVSTGIVVWDLFQKLNH